MNDDVIIQQRISGRSVRAIAKAQATTVAEVNKALDRFTEITIDDYKAWEARRRSPGRSLWRGIYCPENDVWRQCREG